MPRFFLNKRLIILLISIILLVTLIGLSINKRERLTWPEQFLKDSVGFAQSLFHKPANAVAGLFENVTDIKNVYYENKILKSRLDEYVKLSEQVKTLTQENERLREMLGKQESLRDYTQIQAAVIARNPEGWHELITVNKGAQDGVVQDMAVITSKGLIGKVKLVSQFTSTIQLLSALDRTNRISAVIQGEEKTFGLIEGFDEESQALMLKRIPFDAEVTVNQVVVSSGLGGVFPEGLVIGRVVEVVPDEYGLTQTAYVKPAANFYNIDHVMIVKRKMISPPAENTFMEEEDNQ